MGAISFEYTVDVSWGHCDPAGIIFYPTYFRWFDSTFHAFLQSRNLDQRILQEKLGTMGTGLIDAGASFKAPITYGDELNIQMRLDTWSSKTFRLDYEGRCNDKTVVTGHELRGMFMRNPATGEISAAPIDPLRELLQT